MTEKYIKRLY